MKDKIFRIFREELWSMYQFIFLFLPGRLGHYTRGYFLSAFFKKRGGKITIKENVEIHYPQRLIVGHNSGFGRNNIMDAFGCITIGDNVRFGPNVMVATMHHAKIGSVIGNTPKSTEPVIIGDNVWIGHGVTILPGVIVGNNVIIAAGAVVTKNVSDNTTVAGVPAKEIKGSQCP